LWAIEEIEEIQLKQYLSLPSLDHPVFQSLSP